MWKGAGQMITSSANQKIKNITKLLKTTKARREKCAFVVEGRKMFLETPLEMIEQVFISQFLENDAPDNIKEKIKIAGASGIEIEIVSDSVFKGVSDTVAPQGIIAIVKQPHYELDDLLKEESPLFVVLENLQDPGNLGTIIRTAEGAGVSAVIMNRQTVDLFNPKVIRSTMGAVFRVPFVLTDDLKHTVCVMKQNNIKVYAAHLSESVDYVSQSYIEGTAFLVGNEGNGLTDEISQSADINIKIPMEGHLESLNASVAAGLLMYEAYRQRRSEK